LAESGQGQLELKVMKVVGVLPKVQSLKFVKKVVC